MASFHEDGVKLETDALVSLYQLDATNVGGTVYYFTTEGQAGTNVSFGGTKFIAVPIKIDGMTIAGQGSLQTPTLTISNTDGLIQSIVNSLGDLEGSRLTRWRTYARFLDGGEAPDATAFYGPDVYLIDRRSRDNSTEIQWELSALIDKEGVYVGRTVIRDTCMWRYRIFNPATGTFDYSKATCPYAGSKYFDINNLEVASASLDEPSRNIGCCRARFGAKAVLPFGGFPGIVRGL